MSSYRRIRVLGAREQMAYMRAIWPEFGCTVRNGRLTCCGVVKPTDISDSYMVRIDYRVGSSPKVWVEGLPTREQEAAEKRIPHRYADGSICLYYGNEWTS